MPPISDQMLLEQLSRIPLEETGFQLSDLSAIKLTHRDPATDEVNICIELGIPPSPQMINRMTDQLNELAASMAVTLKAPQFKFTPPVMPRRPIKQVKQIVAVASGKGGVGKSTTAANLALALSNMGAKVGMMDADIYGPSQPMMLGIPEGTRPKIIDQKFFEPLEAHGIFVNSMGLLVSDKTPMIWRGPMATGALQQLLSQTLWPELDYLIVDMPPGTGDIHLTLSQEATLSGAVVVTTPQDIALLDAKKGIEMFNKVNIPLLGLIENMATHTCDNCGHESHIFGEAGAEQIAANYGVPVLGQLPLKSEIRASMDKGLPIVLQDPSSKVAQQYENIATQVATQLWLHSLKHAEQPEIEIVND